MALWLWTTSGKISSFNTTFAAIWQFPAGMINRRNAAEMRAYAADQANDPDLFLRQVEKSGRPARKPSALTWSN